MNPPVESPMVAAAINCNPEELDSSTVHGVRDCWATDDDGTEYQCLDRLWCDLMCEFFPNTLLNWRRFESDVDHLKIFSRAIKKVDQEPDEVLTFIVKNWGAVTELVADAEGLFSVPAYPYGEYLTVYFKQLHLIWITSSARLK